MKRRILHSILAVTTISVVLFGVPLAVEIGHVYHQQAVLELQREATRALPELSEDIALHETLLDPPGIVPHSTLGFYDRNGTRVIGNGRPIIHLNPKMRGNKPVLAALDGRVTDALIHGWIITAVPVTEGDHVIGAIRAAVPASIVAGRVHRSWFGMGALAFGIILVAAVVATLQSRRVVEPLELIGKSAERLGDGDFTVRTEPVGVAEIDNLGTVLNSTASRLGDLVARERAFSSDASHQLRTPLTGLRLRLERSLPNRHDHEAAMRDAIDLVDGLCVTVEQLLALARDLPVVRDELDVRGLINDAAAGVRATLAEHGRSIIAVADTDLPVVRASRAAIRQVLDVLVTNAMVHGSGLVTVRARDAAAGVAIEVSDQGRGVDGDIQRIFERRSESAGGHGIGLSLARSLAEAEGGRLVLQRSGPRPTFVLMLLADDDEAAETVPVVAA